MKCTRGCLIFFNTVRKYFHKKSLKTSDWSHCGQREAEVRIQPPVSVQDRALLSL